MKRDKIIRLGAIVIVLALFLSLLAGAFSVAPAQAAEIGVIGKSVQIYQVTSETVDTDGDGIENNEDPDVDGDGLVNGKDSDIDGDGIENFDDADPVDTTDIDSKAPSKPDRPTGAGDKFFQETAWIWISISMVAASVLAAVVTARIRRKQT